MRYVKTINDFSQTIVHRAARRIYITCDKYRTGTALRLILGGTSGQSITFYSRPWRTAYTKKEKRESKK